MKKYIVIAGVNGAGKSTLYQSYEALKDMPRVNTDEIVKEIGDWRNIDDIFRAGKIAVSKIAEYMNDGISFNQETTLCGNSIIRNIKSAKEKGFYIVMNYVGVDNSEIAKERVRIRVSKGGHGIADKDIERRYYDSLENLKRIIDICDEINIYDNSNMFREIINIEDGNIIWKSDKIPEWIKIIL